MARGFTYLYTECYEDAISAFHTATEAAPRFGVAQVFLAAAYSLCGRNDEARAAVLRLLELEPNYCIRNLGAVNPVPLEQMEAVQAALRKAGLPE
jgi:Flp pilus assembly protein TadD